MDHAAEGSNREGVMEIRVKLPDDIAQHRNAGREALEALVIEGYSSGIFTSYEAQLLLGIDDRFDFDDLLKERNVEAGSYGIAEFEQDLRNLATVGEQEREKRSA
jgi:predicted HTH domain antitoxin